MVLDLGVREDMQDTILDIQDTILGIQDVMSDQSTDIAKRVKLREMLAQEVGQTSNDIRLMIQNRVAQQDAAEFLTALLGNSFFDKNQIQISTSITPDMQNIATSTRQEKQSLMNLEFADKTTQAINISSMLAASHSDERMDGKNQYDIGDGTKVDATKKSVYQVNALEFSLQLKRFDNRGNKIQTSVEFDDIVLDDNANNQYQYQPRAIIVHDGDSVKSGHYYVYVKEEGDTWYCYNDKTRTQCPTSPLEDDFVKKNAYLIKYSRPETPYPEAQQGTNNFDGNYQNRCWANSVLAFVTSFASFKNQENQSQEQKQRRRELIEQKLNEPNIQNDSDDEEFDDEEFDIKSEIISLCEKLNLPQTITNPPYFIFSYGDEDNLIPSRLDKFSNDDQYLNVLYENLFDLDQKMSESNPQDAVMKEDSIEPTTPTKTAKKRKAHELRNYEEKSLSDSDSSRSESRDRTPKSKRAPNGQRIATHLTPGGTTKLRDARGRTKVGPQAEHASAYVLFEELIISNIEGQKISDAPNILINVLGCLPIGEVAMENITAEAKKDRPIIISEDRKKITRSIRGTNHLVNYKDELKELVSKMPEGDAKTGLLKGLDRIEEISPSTIKSVIRSSNTIHMSGAVSKIVDICLNGANKMEYASLPSEGVPPNPNTGNERAAKDNLRILSDFLEDIVDMQKSTQQEKLSKQHDLLQDKERMGLLKNKWNINRQTIEDLIHEKIKIDDLFSDIKGQAFLHMGQLIYYPRLDPKNLHRYEIDGKSAEWALSQKEWNEVMGAQPKAKYNKSTTPRNNNPEIMFELVGRHIVLCLNCFRGLSKFNEENQQVLVEDFLENCILINQGWHQEEINGEKIDLECMKDKIASYAKIGYENREFYTKDSAKEKEKSNIKNPGAFLG